MRGVPTVKNLRADGMRAHRGFSLIEVVFAAAIMAVGFAAAAICLKAGVNNIDASRRVTLVSQAMQGELERLRMENWTAISTLPEVTRLEGTLSAELRETLLGQMVQRDELKIERRVEDVAGYTDMKSIEIVAEWTGLDGQKRQRVAMMHYTKGGISDYYYGIRE